MLANLMHERESRFAQLEGPVHLVYTIPVLRRRKERENFAPVLQAEKVAWLLKPQKIRRGRSKLKYWNKVICVLSTTNKYLHELHKKEILMNGYNYLGNILALCFFY